MANRWLFSCCNGWGLGHVARMIGLARRIRERQPDGHFLFLTNSEVPHLFWKEGFASVKMPSFEFYRQDEDRNLAMKIADDVVKALPRSVLSSFRPDAVIMDTFPWGQRLEFSLLKDYPGKKILLHREVSERRWNPHYEAAVKSYELVLLPFLKDDHPLTLPQSTTARWVGPIMPRSRTDLLPREEARARLGIEPE